MDMKLYPTPKLARRAWGKFRNNNFVRVLDPAAGEGHLSDARYSNTTVDCIENDVAKHPLLREKGYGVIGRDFLQFNGPGEIYSHIIMNPPFAEGAKYVLKAWDMLYDGEIVAIVNANAVITPPSNEWETLVRLIQQHGTVEFIEGAFTSAVVEVALVYLRKEAPFQADLMGDILDRLKVNQAEARAENEVIGNEVMIPVSYIENSVVNFNAAVEAMRQAVFAEARARLYADRTGLTIEEMNGDGKEADLSRVQEELHDRYTDLKRRAWSALIRSTGVMSNLPTTAQQRLEAELEPIMRLEFTTPNIHDLIKLLEKQRGEVGLQMAHDIFDLITRNGDNAVLYKGWNRAIGVRVRMTRIVLPYYSPWESKQVMADLDYVFAMLDGRAQPEKSLYSVFTGELEQLRAGQRLSSSYFDVRLYQGAGTIHLFPRNKDLIDRLNRLVGRHRQWLPPEGERVRDQFWMQYEADRFDKAVRSEVKHAGGKWEDLMWSLRVDNERGERAREQIHNAIDTVLIQNGIDPVAMLKPPALVLTPERCGPWAW